MPDSTNPQSPHASDEGDLHGTITGGEQPPRKVTLLFGKRIWIAIFSFLALTVIGAVIEFTVQTPISKYIERVTGPRVRTLRNQLVAENYEFVFRSVKPKFHDEPYDEDYRDLYFESSEGYLRDALKEQEWAKARVFLQEAIDGMPVPPTHRAYLRRMFVSGVPALFQRHQKGATQDKINELKELGQFVEQIALKEKKDPETQFAVGEALAYNIFWRDGYNLQSLPYFEAALTANPGLKKNDLLPKVLRDGLTLDPALPLAETMRDLIRTHYLSDFTSELQHLFRSIPFNDKQVVEKGFVASQRKNAFLILRDTLAWKDLARFHLMTVLHTRDDSKEDLRWLRDSIAYVEEQRAAGELSRILTDLELPPNVPASILAHPKREPFLQMAWPILEGSFGLLLEEYCHERLFTTLNHHLGENCYSILKTNKKLTRKEIIKWSKG